MALAVVLGLYKVVEVVASGIIASHYVTTLAGGWHGTWELMYSCVRAVLLRIHSAFIAHYVDTDDTTNAHEGTENGRHFLCNMSSHGRSIAAAEGIKGTSCAFVRILSFTCIHCAMNAGWMRSRTACTQLYMNELPHTVPSASYGGHIV